MTCAPTESLLPASRLGGPLGIDWTQDAAESPGVPCTRALFGSGRRALCLFWLLSHRKLLSKQPVRAHSFLEARNCRGNNDVIGSICGA